MRNLLRWTRWVAIGAAVTVLGGLAAVALTGAPNRSDANGSVQDDFKRLGQGIEDLTLIDDDGKPTQWGALGGKPRALFFGFTHCPVICPVTVWELNNALEHIGAPADAIAVQFVTLDPERDTPATLKQYFSGFEGRVEGYSATPESIARIARAYDVTYRKTAGQGEDYEIDHTAAVFLLNASGQVVDVVAYGTPPDVLEARLRALLAHAPPKGAR